MLGGFGDRWLGLPMFHIVWKRCKLCTVACVIRSESGWLVLNACHVAISCDPECNTMTLEC